MLQKKPDEVAGDHEAALAVLVDRGELPEAVDEVRPEPEQLHLLGVGVGRDERRQVVHPAADRRRPAGEAVAAPAVARVGDERRDRGDQRDEREERAERDEQAIIETKAIAVWISPNTPLTMNSGRLAAPCWARRSRSYDVGVLEEREVELRGVIHDLELDRVRDPLLEQLLADVPERAQERRQGEDRPNWPAARTTTAPVDVERERADGDARPASAGLAVTAIARTTASISSLAM